MKNFRHDYENKPVNLRLGEYIHNTYTWFFYIYCPMSVSSSLYSQASWKTVYYCLLFPLFCKPFSCDLCLYPDVILLRIILLENPRNNFLVLFQVFSLWPWRRVTILSWAWCLYHISLPPVWFSSSSAYPFQACFGFFFFLPLILSVPWDYILGSLL